MEQAADKLLRSTTSFRRQLETFLFQSAYVQRKQTDDCFVMRPPSLVGAQYRRLGYNYSSYNQHLEVNYYIQRRLLQVFPCRLQPTCISTTR